MTSRRPRRSHRRAFSPTTIKVPVSSCSARISASQSTASSLSGAIRSSTSKQRTVGSRVALDVIVVLQEKSTKKMIALDITSEERQSGTVTPEHLQAAVQALKTDGFAVLNDVIERAHLETL